MNPSTKEHWNRVYAEAPEIFDEFSRAEDPDGLLVQRLAEIAPFAGTRALEIGCGSGRYSRELAPQASTWVALDPCRPLLRLAAGREESARGPRFVAARGQALPLAGNSVDVVLATWVFAYLPPPVRIRVLAEAERVLRRGEGHGIWLLENHWTGEFQELRGRAAGLERAEIRPLIEEHGFEVRDVVTTSLRFTSADAAERVLGALVGKRARKELQRSPRAELEHRVVILHRPSD